MNIFSCFARFFTAFSSFAASDSASAAVIFYVAPNGNDSWTGRIRTPNAGGTDGPLASLTGARDAVRRHNACQSPITPIRIVIEDGQYPLMQPLFLEPQDSGTQACPISYEAAGNASPTFSGGQAITGWVAAGDLWKAEIPEVAAGKWLFQSLFADGGRRTKARTPDNGLYKMLGRAAKKPGDDRPALVFEKGSLKNWENLNEINVVMLFNWETCILPIASVDTENSVVRFTGRHEHLDWWLSIQPYPQYYVENFFEALDAPGEWFLDRRKGMLYYYPMPGEKINETEIVAPLIEQFVILSGKPEANRFVEHVQLKGLSFQYADWILEPGGHGDAQAASSVEAAMQADGARHCSFERCNVTSIGNYGFWFRRGCMGNSVVQCEIADTGAGGVRIGEMVIPENEADATGGTLVSNCYIHDGGQVYAGAIGLWIGQSADNVISHNEMCYHQYSGISVGWTWGYGPSATVRNTIENNHIHHLGQGILFDMAAIYLLGISPGTTVNHNHIHDVHGGGIYPDQGCSDVVIEGNLVYRCGNGALTMHFGKNNLVRNNILALCPDIQFNRGTYSPIPPYRFENNIVYYEKGTMISDNLKDMEGVYVRNLYWNASGKGIRFSGNLKLEQAQARGLDKDSIEADPMFIDPKNDDFRLMPESPALKLGFKPIDTNMIGLTGDDAWVAKPRKVESRFIVTDLPPCSRPACYRDDFEQTAVGGMAVGSLTFGESDKSSVRITDECAASGSKCLKFMKGDLFGEAEKLVLLYFPKYANGFGSMRLDLRIEPGAEIVAEWRQDSGLIGPGFRAGADGQLTAGGKALCTIPGNEWVHIEMTSWMGDRFTGQYNLTVQLPGKDAQNFTGLSCDPEFQRADKVWFVVNSERNPVAVYMDNLEIDLKEE